MCLYLDAGALINSLFSITAETINRIMTMKLNIEGEFLVKII